MRETEKVLSQLDYVANPSAMDVPVLVTLSGVSAPPDVIKQWLAFLRMVYPSSWVRYEVDKQRGAKTLTLRLYSHRTAVGLRVACWLYAVEADWMETV